MPQCSILSRQDSLDTPLPTKHHSSPYKVAIFA
jgi:hypothetical protein